jgi:hypothetical protein
MGGGEILKRQERTRKDKKEKYRWRKEVDGETTEANQTKQTTKK